MSIKNETKVRASIKNIGGIDSTQISLDEGVNLLSGPNSTNKTSTLQALSAVLGSDEATAKSDADEGRVELEVDGDTYYRELTRHGDSVRMEGEPYLDENTKTAELFAFLLDSNEARLAVEKDGDLRDVIMEPVDTNEIQNRISELMDERDSIQERIEEIDSKKERLSELKEERKQVQAKLEGKRRELEEIEERIDDVEEVSEVKGRRNRLDELIETKSDLEDEVDRLDDRISSEKESIGSLEEDIEERRERLEDATDGRKKTVLKEKIEAKEGDIQHLQAKREEVSKVLSELQEVVEFNSRMLDKKERSEILGTEDSDESSKTDMLLEDENEIVCWTCGSEVETSAVSETIEEIKSLRSKKNSRINEITEEIDSLRGEKEELEGEIELIEGLKTEISRREEELERRRNQLEDLETELNEKESELSHVRSEIDEIESELEDAGSETLEAHKLKKEKEVEIDSLEDRVEELDDKIQAIKDEIDELPKLEQEHKEVSEAITEART